MKKVKEAKVDLLCRMPGADLSRYDKIMFGPIEIYYQPDSELKSIEREDLDRLAVYFQTALADAVTDAYPVVNPPGPGVLRGRGAITSLKAGPPLANTASTALIKFSLLTGEAQFEAESLDSLTQKRLVAVVDRKKGRRVLNYKNFTRWGQVRSAFREWAQPFRDRLDFLHGKK